MSLQKPKVEMSTLDASAIETDVKSFVVTVLEEIGTLAVEMIRAELTSASPSGELYKINGQTHRASAPGEVPADLSGQLARSLGFEVSAEENQLLVYSTTPYGNYLEYGTTTMAARPFMGPVMDQLEPQIVAALQRAVGENTTTKSGSVSK